MQNFVKILIANSIIQFLSFFLIQPSHALNINKVEYTNATCYESTLFSECNSNDGISMIGETNASGEWHGNVKRTDNTGTSFLYFLNGEIRYGSQYFDNGDYYLGDLSANNSRYGYGTYYYKNGDKASFRNWHKEEKVGVYEFKSGIKEIGRFDQNYYLKEELYLGSDFQKKINDMVTLARRVKIDFELQYKNFLLSKNNSTSSATSSSLSSTSSNSNSSQASKSNKSKETNQNLIVGFIILLILFFIIWLKGKSSSSTNTTLKHKETTNYKSEDKKDTDKKYNNLSLRESRKLFSYGVGEDMPISQASTLR